MATPAPRNMRISLSGLVILLLGCTAEPSSREAASVPDVAAPTPASSRPSGVWYLDWQPQPTGSRVAGMPLYAVDSSWEAASGLDEIALPEQAHIADSGMEESGARFLLEDDLNGDGQTERAVVGVFRTATGEEGRFLVIFERDSVETWRKVFLATMPGLGFSALTQPAPGTLVWADCLGCDTSAEIRWNGTQYEASFSSCCPDEESSDSTAAVGDSLAATRSSSLQTAG